LKRSEMVEVLRKSFVKARLIPYLPDNESSFRDEAICLLDAIEEAGMLPPLKKEYETLWWNDPTKSVDCQVDEAYSWELEDD